MKAKEKPETYEAALSKAWGELLACNPMDSAKRSKASYDPIEDEFTLTFLGDMFRIKRNDRKVIGHDNEETFPFMAILLLHYLAYAKEIELVGKLISFRELVGGDVYYSAFCRRAIDPITDTFGSDLEGLRTAGKALGAGEVEFGDISLKIDVLPKIPITIILWLGDEEVSASSNMLFDASIKEHLPTEDVAVLGGFVASRLKKA